MYWVIGNEPDVANQETAATYSQHFNTLYDAMKRVDPSIMIGGPATLGFDQPFIQTFLDNSASRVDFVDFHFYLGARPRPSSSPSCRRCPRTWPRSAT